VIQALSDPMSTLFCTTLATRDTPAPAKGITESTSYFPASAAYRTLSRHKDFKRADFGTLMSKLNARGMQVEVNSVTNVLRELDRKLYS
jgi:hypothetical protein